MRKITLSMLVMAAVATIAGPAVNACGEKEKVQSVVIPAEETTVIQTLPAVVDEKAQCIIGPTRFDVTTNPTTLIRELPVVVPAPSCEVIEPGSLVIKEQRYVLPSSTTKTQLLVVPSADAGAGAGVGGSASLDLSMRGPNFPLRLANMMDQINLGESRGWLTSSEASALKSEHASYVADEAAAGADGYSRAEIDDLERKLTAFNITINHELNDGEGSIARQPNLLY